MSWNALALLGWKFGGDLDKAVLFGWRHMEFEIEEDGPGNRHHLRRPDRRSAVQFLAADLSVIDGVYPVVRADDLYAEAGVDRLVAAARTSQG